ncbi:DUF3021 family protein [Terribacillus sp. 179-K 1B1 HS]|uniref:DUF3021 family protein n=1 Tax=Terribacillus sp. 179-K 1B1 HS TaxID=3142388 RepID=UPI00399F6B8B
MKTFVNFIQSWGIMFMFSIFATSIYIYVFIGNKEMAIAFVPQTALITFVLTWIQKLIFSRRANESNFLIRTFLYLLVVLSAFTGAAFFFDWFDTGNWKLLGLLFALVIFIYIILWGIYHLIQTVETKQLNEELANYKRKKREMDENH